MTDDDDGRTLLEDLYVRHRQAIWALCFAWQRDREGAMDGVQDVFLKAWRHIDTLRGLDAAQQKAWLYRTARRQIIDAHRHDLVVTRSLSLMSEPDDSPNGGRGDPAERMEVRERVLRVDGAMRLLPDRLRTVLILAVAGGLAGPEIAELLGIPPATVRSRLSAARRRIRRLLASDGSMGDDPGEAGRSRGKDDGRDG